MTVRSPLEHGVTGFFGPGDLLLQPLDPWAFRRLCHTFALAGRGKAQIFDLSLEGKNFYDAQLRFGDTSFHLLMNAYRPYGAFADALDDGIIRFTDPPRKWPLPLPQPYYLLGAEELSASCLLPGMLDALTPAELAQIRYWKPQTVGQILFNFWD